MQQQHFTYHLKLNRKSIRNNKLVLFGKAITIIDQLKCHEDQLMNLQQIDLSHNNIQKIDNVHQFKNVEVFNLSHNNIKYSNLILELRDCHKLTTLYLKGNPFIKKQISKEVLQFLLSLNTDVNVVSSQVQEKINEITKKIVELQCFINYYRRINLHNQLLNVYKMENSFVDTQISMFSKVKKIFYEQYHPTIKMRRNYVQSIKMEHFMSQKSLLQYLALQLQGIQQKRSEIIKNIYYQQQILRKSRSSYHIKLKTSTLKKNYTRNKILQSPRYGQQLKLSRQRQRRPLNQKMQNVVINIKKNISNRQSPSKKLSQQYAQIKSIQEFECSFMSILTKLNPLYQLLHSPINSLKSSEKELLIQNLIIHLKQTMRETYKLQRNIKESGQVKKEFDQLQNHLEILSLEFQQAQDRQNEKYEKVLHLYNEESNKVVSLCRLTEQYQKNIEHLNKQNQELLKKQKLQAQQKQQQRNYSKKQQILKYKHEQFIKTKYIQLLTHKAYHLSQIKLLRSVIKNQQEANLKMEVFRNIFFNASIRKNYRCLVHSIKRKNNKTITFLLRQGIFLNNKYQHLRSRLKLFHGISFIKALNNNYQRKKRQSHLFKRFSLKKSTVIKKNVFQAFTSLLQERQAKENHLQMIQISRKLKQRKFFKMWQRYINHNLDIEQSFILQRQNEVKKTYMARFIQTMSAQITHCAKNMAIANFIPWYRKNYSLLLFTKINGRAIFQRNLKIMKIRRLIQYKYLYFFISKMQRKLINNRIKIKNNQINRIHRVKQQEDNLKKNLEQREKKIYVLKSIFSTLSSKIYKKILRRQMNTIEYQRNRQKTKITMFFANIKQLNYSNTIFSIKLTLLNKILQKRKIQAISLLKKGASYQVKVKKQYFNKLLNRYFYIWKSNILNNVLKDYKQRYFELQPQIQKISSFQRQLAQQKMLLLRQLQDKEHMIKEYFKKCEDYEFVLQSKDLKYEKLCQIYADTIRQQKESSAKFPSFNSQKTQSQQTFQQVYYKYLPSQIKQQYPQSKPYEYIAKTKIIPESHTYQKLEHHRYPYDQTSIREKYQRQSPQRQTTSKKVSQIKNKFSYISSFRP